MLVASVDASADRRRYLELVFGWYHERSRGPRAFLLAFIVPVAVVLVSQLTGIGIDDPARKPSAWAIAGLVAAILALSVAYLTLGRVLVSPLHREYLCCLDLLRKVEPFRPQLQAAFDARELPEPSTHGRSYERLGDNGMTVAMAVLIARLKHEVAPWDPDAGIDAALWNQRMGSYLFHVLGPVPTDEYERRVRVRHKVDGYLVNARTSSADLLDTPR